MNKQTSKKPYKVGIVLSGGGARGFGHIGVLKALFEAGIQPEVVSGSSAGSIVGALYCDGNDPGQILELSRYIRLINVIRVTIPTNGFMQIQGITSLLRRNIKATRFEELEKPLFVNATDFYKARLTTFESGPLIRPVMASAAIPILFKPVMIDGVAYVDSGLIDNLPVSPLIDKCDYIIGVNANPVGEIEKLGGFTDTIDRMVKISYRDSIQRNKEYCSLYIEPPQLSNYKILEKSKLMEMVDAGYQYTKDLLRYKQHLFGQLVNT